MEDYALIVLYEHACSSVGLVSTCGPIRVDVNFFIQAGDFVQGHLF